MPALLKLKNFVGQYVRGVRDVLLLVENDIAESMLRICGHIQHNCLKVGVYPSCHSRTETASFISYQQV
jgi:hypothetical protein